MYHSSTQPKCILCGGQNWYSDSETTHVIRSRFSSANVVRCRNCGQGQLWPMPSQAEVRRIYESHDYVDSYDVAGEEFAISGDTFVEQLRERFDRIESQFPGRGTMLDVGASRGYFMHAARQRGWQVNGLEAGKEAIEFAKRQFDLEIAHGVIESAELPNEQYDCVHMSHVLEHVLDPRGCIEKLHKALKRNGLLVIEVPYEFGDLFERARKLFLRRPRQSNSVPSTHLHFFTLATLGKLLQQTGFEVIYSATPRRNRSNDSQLPLGTLVKSMAYWAEYRWKRGPLIEFYARKL